MVTKSQLDAIKRYNKENTVSFFFRFNKRTDADIIDTLRAKSNKQGYIKKLIRDDISENL